MSKPSIRVPSYRHHKASGLAVVTLADRDFYLGKYDSAESREEYKRLVGEWLASGATAAPGSTGLSIAELLVAFLEFAHGFHSLKEMERIRLSIRPLLALYSRISVNDFGPLALKAVRQELVNAGLARSTINGRVNCVRAIFRWGVENELVPPHVLHGLQAVRGLRFGRSAARETEPVKPVPDAYIDAVIPHVSPVIAAMIQLQRMTGMRSGEVTVMRACDLNMKGKVWEYTPATHKTAYRGHKRLIYLGPKAQAILKDFLKADMQAYMFSPAASIELLRADRSAKRKTPLSCGNQRGDNRKRSPRRRPGEVYNSGSYRRAVLYGIEMANKSILEKARKDGLPMTDVECIPHWHPHQLRHNAATYLRRQFGIEVARIILGHRSPAITETYAEVDHARAIKVMGEVG